MQIGRNDPQVRLKMCFRNKMHSVATLIFVSRITIAKNLDRLSLMLLKILLLVCVRLVMLSLMFLTSKTTSIQTFNPDLTILGVEFRKKKL